MDKNVTGQVPIYGVDGESVAIQLCVCGKKFDPWCFIINSDKDTTELCPACGRKLYARVDVSIFEVKE